LRRRTAARGALGAVCAALTILGAAAQPAMAAGSGNLWPNPSPPTAHRANTEWRIDSYGNGALKRRTLIKAYMTATEVLMLGSSAVGQLAGDILVYDPGLVTGPIGAETIPATSSFSCMAQRAVSLVANQGVIASRAEELAGPDTIPASVAGAYVPCHYTAPVTGVYDVAFLGPDGAASNADGAVAGDVALAPGANFNATQGSSIAAWDATVRANLASAVDITGRVYTYYLALFTGGNGRPVFPTIFAVTSDGYRYRVDLRGMDPNGWLVYGNQLGFLDSDGKTPLYHDAVAAAGGSPGQLTTIQGGVSLARPSFPLFFELPDPVTLSALGIPAAPIAPTISAISFAGTVGGNTSLVNAGGTFKFTTNVPGVYDIVIARSPLNLDPTLSTNRSLRGAVLGAGIHTVAWDGLDNSNVAFPVGSYAAHVALHGGEYHFPMIDDESNTRGGPTLTLLNPPSGCPALTGGCHTAFYDDRVYMTLNGTIVQTGGTVGNALCGVSPPATTFADPIVGFDSTTTQRAFGITGGNTNAPCTGAFGDAKGLDIWTYNQSSTVVAPLNIVATAADIRVTKSVSDSTPAVGTNVTFTVTARDLGPNDATGVQVKDVLPAGLTLISATPSQGTYNAATGVWDVGSLATNTTATILFRVTVNTTNRVTNTAVRIGGSPVDPNSANNSALARVTGSTIPGLPNTGVPPIATWWPALLALALIVTLIATAPRRSRRSRAAPPADGGRDTE
jgi:uncharacterized repeat protein (TIGR01451 family)